MRCSRIWLYRIVFVIAARSLFPICLDAQLQSDDLARHLREPYTRNLASGEVHSYHLSMQTGQFARINVEKLSIDLVLVLFDPNGRKLTELDGLEGTVGPEPISVLAEPAGGEYRLEVRPADKDAPPGRYQITLAEIRSATAEDRSNVAGERLIAEAFRLTDEPTEQSRTQAIEKYREALRLWGTHGDPFRRGQAFHGIGYSLYMLGKDQEAIASFEQALGEWASAKYPKGKGRTLSSLAAAYNSVGENGKAVDCLLQALPLRRAAGDRAGEAWSLTNLASVYNDLGEMHKALTNLETAFPIWKEVHDPQGTCFALNISSLIYERLGQSSKALEQSFEALKLCRMASDQDREATLLSNIGRIYDSQSDHRKAFGYLERSLQLRQVLGDRRPIL